MWFLTLNNILLPINMDKPRGELLLFLTVNFCPFFIDSNVFYSVRKHSKQVCLRLSNFMRVEAMIKAAACTMLLGEDKRLLLFATLAL